MFKAGVYKIINKNTGKFYIGSSLDLKKRFYEHKRRLRKNIHVNPYLQNAWNLYGEENFEFEVVLYCDSEMCVFYEQKLLDIYKCYDREVGYNNCITAGSTLGFKMSEEAKKKIGDFNRGKVMSEESKQKISLALIGKEFSEEHKQKISENHHDISGENNPMFGKKFTKEHREKIGKNQSKIKQKKSQETIEKLKISFSELPIEKFHQRLVKEDVVEIRRLYEEGNHSSRELAKMFNVSKGHIIHIINRKKWKDTISDDKPNLNPEQRQSSINTLRKKFGKPVERIDMITGEVKEYISLGEAVKDGFNKQHISQCCRNIAKTHYGYYWQFLSKE